jgi:hypothetical protein
MVLYEAEQAILQEQEPLHQFRDRCLHVDLSRGAVYTPNEMFRLVDFAAAANITSLALYTEFFQMKQYPATYDLVEKTGQLTPAEISDIVLYGLENGIEIFPSVETLAHQEKLLATGEFEQYRLKNSRRTLDPRANGIEDFVEDYIVNAIRPYQAAFAEYNRRHPDKPRYFNRLNVGCDETFKVSDQLFTNHLQMVKTICDKHELQCFAWADMLPNLTADQQAQLQGIHFVDWEYNETNPQKLSARLKCYQEKGINLTAVTTSTGSYDQLYPLSSHARRASNALLESAQQEKIPDLWISIWNDGNGESALLPSLHTVLVTTMKAQGKTEQDADILFEQLTHISRSQLNLLEKLHGFIPDVLKQETFIRMANPLKIIIFEDPRYIPFSQYDPEFHNQYFTELAQEIGGLESVHIDTIPLFQYAYRLADFLSIKADFGKLAREAYIQSKQLHDPTHMIDVAFQARTMQEKLQKLGTAHKTLWLQEKKPQGLKKIMRQYDRLSNYIGSLYRDIYLYVHEGLEIQYFERDPEKVETSYPLGARDIRKIIYPSEKKHSVHINEHQFTMHSR